MKQFKVGDMVFLRSNTSYNKNVATGKTALLIPGPYSCEKDEQNTTLVCVVAPYEKTILVNRYWSDVGYRPTKEVHKMIRVFSTATKKCYEIDAEFADIIQDKKDYEYRREFEILDAMINEEFLDMCDYADDYM